MSLQPQTTHNAVVMAVDVGVDAVESLEKNFDGLLETFWERHAGLSWEDAWVAEVIGGPGEEVADVGWSRKTSWLWEVWWIVPEVFELVGSFHLWAGLG